MEKSAAYLAKGSNQSSRCNRRSGRLFSCEFWVKSIVTMTKAILENLKALASSVKG